MIKNVNEDVLSKLSEFALMHQDDPSGCAIVTRGYIYEMMCRRWMSLQRSTSLQLHPLSSVKAIEHMLAEKFEVVRFRDLEELIEFSSNTYYRPIIKNFAGLDAFIVIDGVSYWLQYTLNKRHVILGSAQSRFTEAMERKSVETFNIAFVAIEDKIQDFPRQTIVNVNGKKHQGSSIANDIPQYVVDLDSFWHTSKEDNEKIV